MKYGKRRTETVGNRFLFIEQRLMKKYSPTEAVANGSTPAVGTRTTPNGNGMPSPNGSVATGQSLRVVHAFACDDGAPIHLQYDGNGVPSPNGSVATGQSFRIVRAFACDDGAPIHLRYDGKAFREPGGRSLGGQSHSTSSVTQALPHHFEAFADAANPVCASPPHAGIKPPMPAENKSLQGQNGGTVQVNTTPSVQNPSSQQISSPNKPTRNAPQSAVPDWDTLARVAQQSLPPENEDTFVSDLQVLLTEARRRADTGQETPALSPTPAGQAVVPPAANPPAPPQLPAPTAASPAAQAQIAGTDTVNRHALFDQLGQQMQRAVTFDMGTVSVDKTFAAIEASINAQDAQATQQAQAKRKPVQAKPLNPIEAVEDMALMTAPRQMSSPSVPATTHRITKASSVEAYMLSSDIPLDPGVGGRSIPVSTLETGDLIVSTTMEVPSWLIRFGTQAPVSHAMLYIGNGQIVEAIEEGVVLRSVEEAVAGSYLVVAFRHPVLTPEQALRVRDYAGQQIGKKFNYVGIVRQAGFQLDRLFFCSGKTGDEYSRCIRWVGRVNLGTATNDRFFCSELVLKAYEAAGMPLTTTPPNYSSPGDLPELQQSGTLAYVGHLKYEP